MGGRRSAFTLVELMVVILIILLVSAVVLPAVLPALQHRQVTEAGRLLQAGLVQARAEAVKANAPRGIRLLPDPTYPLTGPILAYNRWVPIEPGPDYGAGQVVIWPVPINNPANPNGDQTIPAADLPFGTLAGHGVPYPPPFGGGVYPYQPSFTQSGFNGEVLMVEQAPYIKNDPTLGLNNPTSWFWTVRIGDSIQIGNSGRKYTIVGPCTIYPTAANSFANPELFVNDGQPGNLPFLRRIYSGGNPLATVPFHPEYLFVVNGQDDDNDGFTDSGFNGVNDATSVNGSSAQATSFAFMPPTDDLSEWEIEQWIGTEQTAETFPQQFVNSANKIYTPFQAAFANTSTHLAPPQDYTINRRPVVSPGARETSLPTNVVIDAASWNTTAERSRLPIDQHSLFCDILLNPTGQAVLTTTYSTPASFGESATFFHFWLSERDDLYPPLAQAGVPYQLPMPSNAANYFHSGDTSGRLLKGERLLLTLFARTGQVTTNSVEFFDGNDPNTPFYDSQLGAREAK